MSQKLESSFSPKKFSVEFQVSTVTHVTMSCLPESTWRLEVFLRLFWSNYFPWVEIFPMGWRIGYVVEPLTPIYCVTYIFTMCLWYLWMCVLLTARRHLRRVFMLMHAFFQFIFRDSGIFRHTTNAYMLLTHWDDSNFYKNNMVVKGGQINTIENISCTKL